MLVLVVGTVALLYTWLIQTPNQPSVGYSAFLADVQSNRIANRTQEDSSLTVKTVDGKLYTVTVPTILTNVLDDMKQAAKDGNITLPASIFMAQKAPDTSWLGLLLTGLLPVILIGGFIFFMMRQAQGTNNQAPRFRQSPGPGVP